MLPKIKRVKFITQDKRIDEYHWMRDSHWPNVTNQNVLKHLDNERKYFNRVMKDKKPQIRKLVQELKEREVLEDKTVSIEKGRFKYYQYTKKTHSYQVYARTNLNGSQKKILLNINSLAKHSKYFRLGTVEVSVDHNKLAYSYENNGSERYKLYIKNLLPNKHQYEEVLLDVSGNIVWDKNSKGFFYVQRDENWRELRVYYHKLRTEQKFDVLVFEETDVSFNVSIKASANHEFLFITTQSSDTSEIFSINLLSSENKPTIILHRRVGVLYYAEYHAGYFYLRINDVDPNFRIIKLKVGNASYSSLREVKPSSESIYIKGFYFAKKFYTVVTGVEGLAKFSIYNYQDKLINQIAFPDQCYSADIIKLTYESEYIRIYYSALNRPESIMDFHYNKKESHVKKVKEIPSGFKQELYETERLHAKSYDGTIIPVSIVYRKDLFKKDGSNPLYLYGYGAYGSGVVPRFNRNNLSLLDRGFVYAIAHVRGGDELGRRWYESGKLLQKQNTFRDFESCLKFLIAQKYTSKNRVAISGGSAGGLIIAYALNEFSELVECAVAKVPFVDVLSTMLDASLPLTPLEYTEWGDPADKKYYRYIKEYSGYDNIRKKEYPKTYVTAGLNDPRVTYWEPAKWVAKLREYNTSANNILLNISFGHSGNSGRFGNIEDIATEFYFVLNSLNIKV